jgi:Na+-driven multidrug efflux pump
MSTSTSTLTSKSTCNKRNKSQLLAWTLIVSTLSVSVDNVDGFLVPIPSSTKYTTKYTTNHKSDVTRSMSTVLEDVDGIGKSTTSAPAPIDIDIPYMTNPAEEDTSTILTVESMIETALTDEHSNQSVSCHLTQEAQEAKSIRPPPLSKIIKFAIPAIGVWLCNPLLSLIDTSAVGLLSGTTQQAALNPATAVTDYGALLVAFMYTATTNLVAAARENDTKVDGNPQVTKTLKNALRLSGFVGAALGAGLVIFSKVLLRSIIGNDAIDPDVFAAATRYVCIRALGMPAAVIIGSAQSACLGMQDMRSPMYVLLAAAIINFLGDLIFVACPGKWVGGAAGAAWATTFSQYAALGMFLKWLTMEKEKGSVDKVASSSSTTTMNPAPPNSVNITDAIFELTGRTEDGKSRRRAFKKNLRNLSLGLSKSTTSSISSNNSNEPSSQSTSSSTSQTQDEKSFSMKGFLRNKLTVRDLFKLPPLEEAKMFWPYVIPVTTTSVGRVSAYVAMSHVVSSSLGTLSMAAQQIIVSLFYVLTPIADSLNLTAQSFIPGLFEKKMSIARSQALRKARNNFVKAGSLFGAVMAASVGSIPLLSGYFTSDPLVIAQVNSIAPILAGCFAAHGFITGGEGVLLGQKDLGFLGKIYAMFFVAVPMFMLRLKKQALAGANIQLTSIWNVFFGYQLARAAMFQLRSEFLLRRLDKESRSMGR